MALRIWNPFKPHVAKVTDFEAYVVRKLTMSGWIYKDVESNYWWLATANAAKYILHHTPQDAAEACITTKKKPFARLYAY